MLLLAVPPTEHWFVQFSFWLFVSLLILVLLIFVRTINRREKDKLDSIRKQISLDLHDNVGSTLGSIKFLTEDIQKRLSDVKEEDREDFYLIGNYAKEAIDNMNDIVWFVSPRTDGLESFLEKMESYARNMARSRGMEFHFNHKLDTFPKLKVLQSYHAFLMFREAVNNAVKHSAGSQLQVNIYRQEEVFHLVVQDNGIGFDITEQYNGFGLSSYAHRAKEAKITYKLHSEPSRGTLVDICIPIL